MRRGRLRKVSAKHALFTGFIAIFPITLTAFVFGLVWNYLLGPISIPLGLGIHWLVKKATGIKAIPEWTGVAAALVVLVVATYLLGLIVTTFFGKRLMSAAEWLFTRIPVVNSIYPYARQLSEFIFGEHKMTFRRVVAVQYPRLGMYSLGFVTSDGLSAVSRIAGKPLLAVFVPTSPTPFTGWTIQIPADEVVDLDIPVDDAVRFIVSCGVLTPGQPAPVPPQFVAPTPSSRPGGEVLERF